MNFSSRSVTRRMAGGCPPIWAEQLPDVAVAGDSHRMLRLRLGAIGDDLAFVVFPFAAAVVVRVLDLQEPVVGSEPVDGYALPSPFRRGASGRSGGP